MGSPLPLLGRGLHPHPYQVLSVRFVSNFTASGHVLLSYELLLCLQNSIWTAGRPTYLRKLPGCREFPLISIQIGPGIVSKGL